jgi:hypothetical protein
MARPKRGNYATGEAGLARYKEALRKYLAKTKKTEVKKTEVKKPVAKKPVAKKPATKKPAAKKPVAKKPPVKKPVAKKPATTTRPKRTANQLKIKKATTTAQKAIKKATPVVKKAAKTVAKKAGEAKKTVTKKAGQLRQAIKKGRAPAPKTPQQKAVSKAYRGTKKYAKTALKKGGKDLLKIGKGILKNPKSAIKGGLGGIATEEARKIINRRVDSVFAKRKGMSVDEYRAAKKKALKGKGIISAGKNLVNKIKGKSGDSPITKKTITKKTNNTGLKTKKTERSSRKNTNKDYNAPTATKTADKRFSTFRVDSQENRKLQLERQKGNKETYSRKLTPQAKKTKKAPVTSEPKKMSAIEKRNRQRFGDAYVDRLKIKNKEFQSIKRIKDRKERKKKREEYRQKYGR